MKKRLDVLVYESGHADSRERAKAIIMSGNVYVNNQKADKPGTQYDEDVKLEVRSSGLKYVSRGGLKLEKAMSSFPIDLKGAVCLDIGASTGGFTDCMLQNGAEKVYSVDVGYGQLAWKLRTNPKVINMERTNFRNVTNADIKDTIDFFSVDVSFISLRIILPVARKLLSEKGTGVCLIKPQFEAGRENVGKKGVVRDQKVHARVIESISSFALECGFDVLGLDFSPVKGPEGNIEYLMYVRISDNPQRFEQISAEELSAISHSQLDK